MSIEELIGKLEQATGPDRVVDAEIARAVGWKTAELSGATFWYAPSGQENVFGLPYFTSSLDAALTLVPNGVDIVGMELWPDYNGNGPLLECQMMKWIDTGPSVETPQLGSASGSPAIALCIAALKARTSMESNHE